MKVRNLLLILLGGILFGFGLAWSGMAKPEVVLSFLQLKDLGLLLVLGTAVITTLITYQLIARRMNKPVCATTFSPYTTIKRKKVILGAIIFGIGWGISGLCPGSALASIGMGNTPILIGIVGIFAGAYVQGVMKK